MRAASSSTSHRERHEDQHSLVIFDCDGVLIDSEVLSCDKLIEELAAIGIAIDRDYAFRHLIGHGFSTVAERIGKISGRNLPQDFEARYRTALARSFDSSLKPMEGIFEILENLAVPYCMATSSSSERAERSLAAAGLTSLVDQIITASMVAHGKPAPDLFLLAAERMRAEPRNCLVIEDSIPGILAARAAGMKVWRFTGGSHFPLGFGAGDKIAADGSLSRWGEFFGIFPNLRRNP